MKKFETNSNHYQLDNWASYNSPWRILIFHWKQCY